MSVSQASSSTIVKKPGQPASTLFHARNYVHETETKHTCKIITAAAANKIIPTMRKGKQGMYVYALPTRTTYYGAIMKILMAGPTGQSA